MSVEIIVTGGRDYKNYNKLHDVLVLFQPTRIIQGGASGADRLAREFAEEFKIKLITHMANWEAYGKSAGPRRNKEMVMAHPDAIIVAFPGGTGTENCVEFAMRQGRIILRVEAEW